ncbi:DUF397 domain-containing protein [Streptomyces olivoreticuli]
MPQYHWQKSSYCSEGNACLNIAAASDGTLRLRESDNPGSMLAPAPAMLGSLISTLKGNRFSREGRP